MMLSCLPNIIINIVLIFISLIAKPIYFLCGYWPFILLLRTISRLSFVVSKRRLIFVWDNIYYHNTIYIIILLSFLLYLVSATYLEGFLNTKSMYWKTVKQHWDFFVCLWTGLPYKWIFIKLKSLENKRDDDGDGDDDGWWYTKISLQVALRL